MIQFYLKGRTVIMEKMSFEGKEIPVKLSYGCNKKMQVLCSLYGTEMCPDKECSGYFTCQSSKSHSNR